jgi:chemotaxis protein methyltransferase CheR
MRLSSIEFNFLRELVRRSAAIVLEPGKEYLCEDRLARVAKDAGLASLSVLVSELRSHPSSALQQRVIEAMTTNETSFFRDRHPFQVLKKTVLPALIAKRAAEKRLVIWSAGCSSGQEAYSIAMILRDGFPELAGWNVRIIAGDISREMLQRVREGIYSQLEVNRGLPAAMLVRYFDNYGPSFKVRPQLTTMVEPVEMNLAGDWPLLPAPDVVFLRNVLIYFDVETKARVMKRVRSIMRPEAYLFLGTAENPPHLEEHFETLNAPTHSAFRARTRSAGSIPSESGR